MTDGTRTLFNAAVSTSVNSEFMPVREGSGISFQCIWDGTLNGTFTYEATNTCDNLGVPNNWVDTGETFPANPAGSPGATLERWSGEHARYVRIVFTRASGSGNLNIVATSKMA